MERERILTYSHYFILCIAIITAVYLGSVNFYFSEQPNKSTELVLYIDSNRVGVQDSLHQALNDSLLLDSYERYSVSPESNIVIDTTVNEVEPKPYSFEDSNEDKSEKVSIVKVNEEAKTWFRIIIDFLETIAPMAGPIISYYFVRRERKLKSNN